MSKKIMITGVRGLVDSGEIALIYGAINTLKMRHPDLQFYLGSTTNDIDEIQLKKIFPEYHSDIRLIKGISSNKIPWTIRAILLLPIYIPFYARCNGGLHIGGDGYSDIAWHNKLALLSPLTHSYQHLLGCILRKPVVACSMSIGPFKSSFSRYLARFTLNRINLITPREKITENYLKNLGVKTSTHLVADLAFLMEPWDEGVDTLCDTLGISFDRQYVCMAPSQLIPNRLGGHLSNNEKRNTYVKLMADIVDFFMDESDLETLILCQTTGDRHDDRVIAELIKSNSRYEPIILDNTIFTPQQIKLIISRCQLMISSKLHSSIASTSMRTPTITLAYHPKIFGIIGDMVEQKELIIDIRNADPNWLRTELFSRIDKCLKNYDQIQEHLDRKIPVLQLMAFSNIAYCEDVLELKSKNR